MKKLYDVTVRVDPARLATILEALDGACELRSVRPAEVEPGEPPKKYHYKDGIRNKGIRGEDLLLSLLKAGPCTRETIDLAFVSRGFAEKSAGPLISKLRKEGKIGFVGGKIAQTGTAKARTE